MLSNRTRSYLVYTLSSHAKAKMCFFGCHASVNVGAVQGTSQIFSPVSTIAWNENKNEIEMKKGNGKKQKERTIPVGTRRFNVVLWSKKCRDVDNVISTSYQRFTNVVLTSISVELRLILQRQFSNVLRCINVVLQTLNQHQRSSTLNQRWFYGVDVVLTLRK